jgi:hypothetical protein
MTKTKKKAKGKRPRPVVPDLRENALEADPRFSRFSELYVTHQGARPNALQAAIAAGYSEIWAKSHAWRLVQRLRLKVGPVLRAHGLDEVLIARKLSRLVEAREPKWNPKKLIRRARTVKGKDGAEEKIPEIRGGWDKFESSSTQLGAIDRLITLLDLEPAKKLKGDTPDGAIPIRLMTSIPKRGDAVPGTPAK